MPERVLYQLRKCQSHRVNATTVCLLCCVHVYNRPHTQYYNMITLKHYDWLRSIFGISVLFSVRLLDLAPVQQDIRLCLAWLMLELKWTGSTSFTDTGTLLKIVGASYPSVFFIGMKTFWYFSKKTTKNSQTQIEDFKSVTSERLLRKVS